MQLLFITSNRIGDAVISTGILSQLVDRHPYLSVTVACGEAAAPVFMNVPGLERIIILKKHHWIGHWFDLWRHAIRRHWDLVVDLRGSGLAFVLRAKERIRFRATLMPIHRVAQLSMAMKFDPPAPPKLWLSPEDEARAAALVPRGTPLLALAPTANWHGKQWPIERFIAAAKRLTAADGPLPDGRIMVVGGGGVERETALPLLSAFEAQRVIDLLGNTDLLTAAAALRRADLFIGNDSAPMHMAAALGVPTLGLFGPSREIHYAPYGSHCRAVRGALSYDAIVDAPDYDRFKPVSYMTSLSIDAVVAAALSLVKAPCAA